jgi:hypothetical protein
MGPQRDMFRVYTSKSVDDLSGNTVWVIAGQGSSPKQYTLSSVFIVSDVGEADHPDFKNFARGDGHRFDPPPEVNDLDWFTELRKKMANFSFGLQEITEQNHVHKLLELANRDGFTL